MILVIKLRIYSIIFQLIVVCDGYIVLLLYYVVYFYILLWDIMWLLHMWLLLIIFAQLWLLEVNLY